MDGTRFDGAVRAWGARTRRGALGLLAGGLATLLAGGGAGARCRAIAKTCDRKRDKCCGGAKCKARRCLCTGGKQDSGGVCATPPTCGGAGSPCAPAGCCSDLCAAGVSCVCSDAGQPCHVDDDCCDGGICRGFVCLG